MPLKKSVLITGCSNGIGLAVAKGLQNEFHVIATARKLDDVKSLTESGFDTVQLDLANEQSIEVGFQKVLALTDGKIYGLFHNAGYAQIGAIEELPTKALIEQFQINFFSWHHLTRLVMPIMREQNEGRIIFNSSMSGLVAGQFNGAYTATKHALEGYADTLRHELYISKLNVHVSLLEPGPVESKIRGNAVSHFEHHIDPSNSPYQLAYGVVQKNLHSKSWKWHFTLPASSCIKPVKHALESKNPKARYPVTIHTRLFSFLHRLLPTKAFDIAAFIL